MIQRPIMLLGSGWVHHLHLGKRHLRSRFFRSEEVQPLCIRFSGFGGLGRFDGSNA